MTRAERHARAAALVASGRSITEVAAELRVCRTTVYNICHRLGVLPSPVPRQGTVRPAGVAVRNVHDSMDAPEWAGICLYRRATAEACRQVATWASGNCLACDEHREVLHCSERLRRMEVAG